MTHRFNVLGFLLAGILCLFGLDSQGKKPLDHDAFDSWESLRNYEISNNGEWAVMAVAPQEGDATLIFYNTKTGNRISLQRGYNPTITADSKWGLALIKPLFSDTRKAKIDGKSGLDLPQDSLAVINLQKGTVELISNAISYKTGKEGGEWFAYQSVDTIYADKKDLSNKKAGKPLVVRTFSGSHQKVMKWVDDYRFPKNGSKLAVRITKPDNDTTSTNGIGVMLLPDTAFYLIDRDRKFYGVPVFDETASKLAYTAGNDSSESGTKRLDLYLSTLDDIMKTPRKIDLDINKPAKKKHYRRPHVEDPELQGKLLKEWQRRMNLQNKDSLYINQYSEPVFSNNGKRLIIGVAPYIAPDDTTIINFERADLDIWRWDAPLTPPQEQAKLSELKKKLFPVVISLDSGTCQLIDSNPLASVSAPDRWDGDWALVSDPTDHMVERQWNYLASENLGLVNVITGEKREVASVAMENSMLSPADKFVLWFADHQYHAYEIATGESKCISAGVQYPLWDIDDDHPMEGEAYGLVGWTENDEDVLVYDKYDIWVLDPRGIKNPYYLTGGEGRKTSCRFRFRSTDDEQRFIKRGEEMLLTVFDFKDKCNGIAFVSMEGRAKKPELKLLEGASFTQIRKAKKTNVFSWQRASFEIMPQIWVVRSLDFSKALQVTDANPQAKDYSWGTAQLFKWQAYNGKESEGVLYLPEDFSPEKEYPMLAVFYETGSDRLYNHFTMEPSWSWINYPFYVSRGYVVFVPDIHYTDGVPGESAYNYVCSGVEAVCDLYPNIDRKRIGIDGQSWGGYQTAYLVTRTDMFACAGSGAPVANMTSAFGGIRWESGDSRQAQYEMGQSRIGRNLWEATDLYVLNSPLFRANKCNTPLLIMHNDADGAVPWYQGIEMFMALRRLQKPVWLLQYNGEAHNLKERRNCKDITVRLQQFFDHYLKGDPMPRWMREGISPLRKGQEMGY